MMKLEDKDEHKQEERALREKIRDIEEDSKVLRIKRIQTTQESRVPQKTQKIIPIFSELTEQQNKINRLILKEPVKIEIKYDKKRPKLIKFFSNKEAFKSLEYFMDDFVVEGKRETMEELLNYREEGVETGMEEGEERVESAVEPLFY